MSAYGRVLSVITLGLLVLAAGYYYIGFKSLLTGAGETVPVDFRLRWMESRLLMEGKDSHRWGHPDPELPPRLRWQRDLGGGYPPWATGIGLVLAPPLRWSVARVWFAVLNVLALSIVSVWAYGRGIALGRHFALFLVAAALACASSALCISYGQYAVLILASVLLASVALERKRPVLAGLAMGFSLIKPQLGALVVIVTLLRRQVLPAVIAGTVVIAGSAIMWVMTGIDPVTALRESQLDAKSFSAISINPLTVWLLPVLGFETTTLLLGFSLLGVGCVVASMAPKQASLQSLIAMALVISMFWSYRRGYDCPLMTMPMVLLFEAAARRRDAFYWIVAWAFGLSLWAPIRNEQWTWTIVQIAHLVIWSSGSVLILADSLLSKPLKSRAGEKAYSVPEIGIASESAT